VYSDDAKTVLADVPPQLIASHGAVSSVVAGALARGARTRLRAKVGVGITGIAGPGGATPAGRWAVFVATTATHSAVKKCRWSFTGREPPRLRQRRARLPRARRMSAARYLERRQRRRLRVRTSRGGRHRAPYARAAIEFLVGLVDPSVQAVLDLGAGTGNVARELAPSVDRVDAIEPSATMIAEGKRLPNGHDARLRWIHAAAEDAPLAPPYGLATAGSSLHWMDWDVVLPRVASALTSTAMLAILETEDPLWTAAGPIQDAIVRHSIHQGTWRKIDLIASLVERGRFTRVGARSFTEPFRQNDDELVGGLLSSSSLSAVRIGADGAAAFADEVRRGAPRDKRGLVTRKVVTSVVWGRPS
jgi:SAM-dependent methyltransferase